MYRMLSTLVVAFMAMTAMTAPTPSKTITKRSFQAKAKGHGKPSPHDAMQRAAQKYGFEISAPESDIKARHWDHDSFSSGDNPWAWLSAFLPEPSASGSPGIPLSSFELPAFPSASASSSGFGGVPSGIPFSSGFPIPSGSAVLSSGLPFSSGFPFPSGSAVPSSGLPFPSGSAPASSGAPPAPSSAQPSGPSSAQPSSPAPSGGGDGSGEVSADPEENESMYLSPVTIGGSQTLDLDFDTGSSDLWVMTAQAGAGAGITAFDSSKSSSWQPYQGGSWEISYGDGSSASGTVGFDKVTIGGITATKQAVELAEQVSSSFLSGRNLDGLLGLGFSSINTVQPQQQKTFWENILPQLDQPLFTADLEEDNSGTYEFGNIDSSKYTGEIHYTPVDNSAGFWQVTSESYTVGGTEHQCQTCSPTIMDTGTSLILMDADVVKEYYSQVSGAQFDSVNQGYMYPCSTQLPDFGLVLSGYNSVIKGEDMTYAQSGSSCFGGLQSSEGAGINIIGDVYFKQLFTVFDAGNMRFGVAEKA